jgi:hypothetical protein
VGEPKCRSRSHLEVATRQYVRVDQAADDLVGWLQRQPNTRLEDGLTAQELDQAALLLRVEFPPLWRQVLSRVLPTDGVPRPQGLPKYPDWRLRDFEHVQASIDRPVDGLIFDVENNAFWWAAWGPRPDSKESRSEVARKYLATVPRLIPIIGHRYVANTPASPVFSIVQADLYVPAVTLHDLATGRDQDSLPDRDWPIGDVPFWSDLHAWSQTGHYDQRFQGFGQAGL